MPRSVLRRRYGQVVLPRSFTRPSRASSFFRVVAELKPRWRAASTSGMSKQPSRQEEGTPLWERAQQDAAPAVQSRDGRTCGYAAEVCPSPDGASPRPRASPESAQQPRTAAPPGQSHLPFGSPHAAPYTCWRQGCWAVAARPPARRCQRLVAAPCGVLPGAAPATALCGAAAAAASTAGASALAIPAPAAAGELANPRQGQSACWARACRPRCYWAWRLSWSWAAPWAAPPLARPRAAGRSSMILLQPARSAACRCSGRCLRSAGPQLGTWLCSCEGEEGRGHGRCWQQAHGVVAQLAAAQNPSAYTAAAPRAVTH